MMPWQDTHCWVSPWALPSRHIQVHQLISSPTKFSKKNKTEKGHNIRNNSSIYWIVTDPICDRKDQAVERLLAWNAFIAHSSSQLLRIQKAIPCTKGTYKKNARKRHFLIKLSELGWYTDEESASFEEMLECCPEISYRQMVQMTSAHQWTALWVTKVRGKGK